MGKVIEFPSMKAQGLAYLDRQLRCLLQSKGADQPLIDFAATQLTQIYAQLCEEQHPVISLRLPEGMSEQEREHLGQQISNALEDVRQENHAAMVKLVAQLVLAEVRLFQHQRSD